MAPKLGNIYADITMIQDGVFGGFLLPIVADFVIVVGKYVTNLKSVSYSGDNIMWVRINPQIQLLPSKDTAIDITIASFSRI